MVANTSAAWRTAAPNGSEVWKHGAPGDMKSWLDYSQERPRPQAFEGSVRLARGVGSALPSKRSAGASSEKFRNALGGGGQVEEGRGYRGPSGKGRRGWLGGRAGRSRPERAGGGSGRFGEALDVLHGGFDSGAVFLDGLGGEEGDFELAADGGDGRTQLVGSVDGEAFDAFQLRSRRSSISLKRTVRTSTSSRAPARGDAQREAFRWNRPRRPRRAGVRGARPGPAMCQASQPRRPSRRGRDQEAPVQDEAGFAGGCLQGVGRWQGRARYRHGGRGHGG